MMIVDSKRQKKTFDEFVRRHGSLSKLMNGNKLIGFLARSEFSSQTDDIVDVGICISFNIDWIFDFGKMKKSEDCQHSKFFSLSDMKNFSLMRNLKMNRKSAVSEDNPYDVIVFTPGDDIDVFNAGIRALVNRYVNEAIDFGEELKYKTFYSDSYGRKTVDDLLSTKYNDLYEYLYRKVQNVLKYYKNKKIRLFFN